MKKRVEELLAGRLKDNGSWLEFSVKGINASVPAGSIYTDSFSVFANDESEVRAFVVTDSRRIQVNRERFAGKQVKIFTQIDTAGLSAGESVSGNIIFLTHIGKYKMPVLVSVEKDSVSGICGAIESIGDFASLAENDFREAFRVFNGSQFKSVVKNLGPEINLLYKGLSKNPVTYQHLEEFLIAAGTKDKIVLSTDKDRHFFYISEDQRENLVIKKNTWGHTDISVVSDCDFILISSDHLTEDDFLGNTLNYEIILLKNKVGSRPKKGNIKFITPYQSLEIRIEVSSTVDDISPFVYRQSQIASFLRLYIKLKQNRMNYRTWYESSLRIVEEMKEEDENGFALYAEMFLCCSKEDNRALIELLWKVKSGKVKADAPWQRAAYLYFAKYAGLLPVEERDISSRLAGCYRREPSDYIPLAFYLKDIENDNPARNLDTLEKAYDSGCNSPLMYIDAWNIIKRRESLLRRVTPFILHMLYYVERNGMLLESVLMRAAFLIDGSAGFDRNVLEFLQRGYEKYPGRELLEVICRYIMNGNPSDRRHYKWFSMAVDEGIRMTRLFEYYMETRPEDDRSALPLPVKIYFSYSPVLGDNKRAFLYSLIIQDKDSDPVAYENYRETMHIFAHKSLKAGKINENYAIIYEEFFGDSDEREVLESLAEMLFTRRFGCGDENMRAVAVCHAETEEEEIFRITDKRAYPNVYTPMHCLFLEDRYKRRYVSTIPFTEEPILDTERIAQRCYEAGVMTSGMNMYFCFDPDAGRELNGHTLLMYWSAAEDPKMSRESRDLLRKKILDFFLKNPRTEAAVPYVEKIKGLTYAQVDKEKTIELLMRYGRYESAYEILEKFGCENVSVRLLSSVISKVIRNRGYEDDENLVLDALYVYLAGGMDKEILEYLCRFLVNDPVVMDDIRQKAANEGIDTFAIEERILLFIIFVRQNTRHAKEIFDHYRNNGGRSALCRAYVTFLGLIETEKKTGVYDNV